MKFPHSMLLDFVQTDLDAQAIGDLLTMAGFELEGIEAVDGEPVLDIKVMSNRGDGLSVFGLSREVLAKDPEAKPTELYRRAAAYFGDVAQTFLPDLDQSIVTIETDDCTRYGAALFSFEGGETPGWMAKRLAQAGMRPISLLVDVTNYVLLEIGQPLHAFDRDGLAGRRIVVRKARPGEKLTTLNGEDHDLRPDQMMICDAEKPVAVAGVMGGLESEVTETTTNVLLESAHFINTSIRRTRKQLNLNTEASYRFKRSVDRELVVAGLARTIDLLRQITGAAIDATVCLLMGATSPRSCVALRVSKASELLGMAIESAQAREYLARLGFGIEGEGDRLDVQVPTWRTDISREVDLAEEIGRVHGFEKIPEALPDGVTTRGGVHGALLQKDRLIESLLRLGFVQVVSHSLRTEHALDAVSERIAPRVPASPEYAILRNSLLPSLADTLKRNGGRDLHLFEVGSVFRPTETTTVAVLSTGNVIPPRRKTDSVPEADFYSLKAALTTALGDIGISMRLTSPTEPDSRFHPTRQAAILAGCVPVGIVGQIHPTVAESISIPPSTVIAEIDLVPALETAKSDLGLRELSRHPSVRRDLSVLVDKKVPYEQIERLVRETAGPDLEKDWLFDVYDGTGLPEGKHALGIALQLRKLNATFTDEEANQVRERVALALASVGATMR